jgi:glucokinase
MNELSTSDSPVNADFFAGIDVGGTKVQIVDSFSTTVWRYPVTDFADMYALLDAYFTKMNARPRRIVIGMAGPRDDATGAIKLTNGNWPVFEPESAQKRYPRTSFATANDMAVTTAGVVYGTGVDLVTLKSGMPAPTGTKVVVTISTGIGVAAAVWDERSKRYVILSTEGGHIGFQPKNDAEQQYLLYLSGKYPYASAELALSGMHGIENLIDYLAPKLHASELIKALRHARGSGQPVGAVLLEFATEANGVSRDAAGQILAYMGAMIGSLLRDYAVAYKATGGVYLTGSVSLGLSEYFAENTEMDTRFVHAGAAHDGWIQNVPIYLLSDPYIAAAGALGLAKES